MARWLVMFVIFMGQSTAIGVEVAVDGGRFLVNDKPVFLLGCSYYGALGAAEQTITQDLEQMKAVGFDWIRVWATWGGFGKNVSAIDEQGQAREPYLGRLKWLVEECDRRGMLVDVTLTRGDGKGGSPRLLGMENHRRAVETLAESLKGRRNWWIDLSNERNVRDKRFTSIDDLATLLADVKKIDPKRLVTASHAGGELSKQELDEYLNLVKVDFVSVHRPRDAKSPGQTQQRTKEIIGWMKELQRVAPLVYDEPFRRGYESWNPTAEDFMTDLRGARAGGAAGWCFHNGSQRGEAEGRPRRSFDLSEKGLFEQLDREEHGFLKQIKIWK